MRLGDTGTPNQTNQTSDCWLYSHSPIKSLMVSPWNDWSDVSQRWESVELTWRFEVAWNCWEVPMGNVRWWSQASIDISSRGFPSHVWFQGGSCTAVHPARISCSTRVLSKRIFIWRGAGKTRHFSRPQNPRFRAGTQSPVGTDLLSWTWACAH